MRHISALCYKQWILPQFVKFSLAYKRVKMLYLPLKTQVLFTIYHDSAHWIKVLVQAHHLTNGKPISSVLCKSLQTIY